MLPNQTLFIYVSLIPNQLNSVPKTFAWSTKGCDPCRWSIYRYFKQVDSISTLLMYDIYDCIVHFLDDIYHYSTPKPTHEWTVRPRIPSLCSSTQRSTIKMMCVTYLRDCVWLGKRYVYEWVEICPGTRWQTCKDPERRDHS